MIFLKSTPLSLKGGGYGTGSFDEKVMAPAYSAITKK
jgi:hypothetical protein